MLPLNIPSRYLPFLHHFIFSFLLVTVYFFFFRKCLSSFSRLSLYTLFYPRFSSTLSFFFFPFFSTIGLFWFYSFVLAFLSFFLSFFCILLFSHLLNVKSIITFSTFFLSISLSPLLYDHRFSLTYLLLPSLRSST